MVLRGVKQIGQASAYGVWSVPDNAGGGSLGSFRQSFAKQLKENYRDRVTTLFDEINKQATESFSNIDMVNFERYRGLIRELVAEVVNHAFSVDRECVLDRSGRQRVYSSVSVIDGKLDELASNILGKNLERIAFISRIDEIRGLVMDILQ